MVAIVGITTIGTEDTEAAAPTTVIGATTDMEATGMDTEPLTPTKDWVPILDNIQVIREFPKPHEELFTLAEKVPYWWQLSNSAPVLAFMVARCWCFDGLPKEGFIERVKKYVLLKRTEICEVMGFPANDRTVRLLQRVWINSEDSTPYLIADLKVMNMLMRWEPSSYEVWEHEEYISDSDICRLATGCHMSRDCPWTFRKYHFWVSLHRSEWFFRIPLAKRMWLTKNYGHAARHYDRFPVHQHFLKDLTPLFRLRSYQQAETYLRKFQVKLDAIYTEAMSGLPKEKDEETGEDVTRLELINRTLNRQLPEGFNAAQLLADLKALS